MTSGEFFGTSRGIRPLSSLLAVWFVALLATSAGAHELEEHRHLLISVGAETVQVLVAYELPSSALARDVRTAIDQDGSGAVDRDAERLAQAQLLLPRITAGWHVELGGEALVLEATDIELRELDGRGARRGFEGVVVFEARVRHAVAGEERSVSLSVDESVSPVRVELQVLPPLEIAATPIPPAADAPVIGPVDLQPGRPFVVTIRFPAPSDSP